MTEHHGRKGARSKYKFPQQRYANQVLNVKLFCYTNRCNNYTQGKVGYNGDYTDEDGTMSDLRNEVWYCDKHSKKVKGK
jgi:hypothetical protein